MNSLLKAESFQMFEGVYGNDTENSQKMDQYNGGKHNRILLSLFIVFQKELSDSWTNSNEWWH